MVGLNAIRTTVCCTPIKDSGVKSTNGGANSRNSGVNSIFGGKANKTGIACIAKLNYFFQVNLGCNYYIY